LLLDTASGQITKIERVVTFTLAAEGSRWLLYRPEPPKASPAKPPEPKTPEPKTPEKKDEPKKKADHRAGDTWMLRDLSNGKEEKLEEVSSASFDRLGQRLLLAYSTKDGKEDRVVWRDLARGSTTVLSQGLGRYLRATMPQDGGQVAFLSDRDDYAAKKPVWKLYHWREGQKAAAEVPIAKPEGWVLSDNGALIFSEKGLRLRYGVAPPAEDDLTTPDDDKVTVDVWNWQDRVLMSQQLQQAATERNRTYEGWVDTKTGKALMLEDATFASSSLSEKGDGRYALLWSDLPYRKAASWIGGVRYDFKLRDLETGQDTVLATGYPNMLSFSPDGTFLSGYNSETRAWEAIRCAQPGAPVAISAGVPELWDAENDVPDDPSSFGSPGYTTGDAWLLVNTRTDVWALDPNGKKPPYAVTQGRGKGSNTVYRLIDLDPEEDAHDLGQRQLFSMVRQSDMSTGYARLESGKLNTITLQPFTFGGLQKARKGEAVVFTKQDWSVFPDLWASANGNFVEAQKLTDANPQQAQYIWGTAEYVHYTTVDGLAMRGILVKPENFDYGKKYPLIAYFYDRDSDSIRQYRSPAPSASTVNINFYASQGYVVVIPDIPYKIGYPGESALAAVVPAVQAVASRGYIDTKRMGIQGQSWGGYQVAQLVTETNMFAAGCAGAPVSNMFSAYGGIRNESGLVRQMQYERGQSRIGGTMWEMPMRYWENSPIFHADKVRTPLLIMANDRDGAVPWQQGIEYFTALRRLERPCWLLNYNGEAHNLMERRNRKDFTMRMQQFFDHYLKGAPMPEWMAAGLPATRKGKTMGLGVPKG
jgi:dipeptidyl aminopeptidase/acylaminoacyl peptidase